jgi:4,5-DOPA dioxygenase extradiol
VARLDTHPTGLRLPRPPFLPLLYVVGAAGATGQDVDVRVDGQAYGSLSMTAYTVGLARQGSEGDGSPRTASSAQPDSST